ncbi:MAG: hypothetical protein ACXVCV_06165, partial [Polyangia bacterium]
IILTSTASAVAGDVASAANATNAPAARQVGTAFGAVYAAMLVLFYSPYPILLLVYFSRDRIRAAMTA